MNRLPNSLNNWRRPISRFRRIGVIVGIRLFISEAERISIIVPNLIGYAYLTLFLLCGILIFLWIWATQKELELFFEWFDPRHYDPPSSFKEIILILFFAVLFIVLIFTSRDPFVFGIVFTIYNFGQIFAGRILMQELRLVIDKSRERLEEDLKREELKKRATLYLKGINVLETYYFRRPQMSRVKWITIFSVIGLILAFWWRLNNLRLMGFLSYLVFILTIIVSEIIIAKWRIERDDSLRTIIADLKEIEREAIGI